MSVIKLVFADLIGSIAIEGKARSGNVPVLCLLKLLCILTLSAPFVGSITK